jgi:osmoprotectant transport system substrate-binding protein
MKLMAGLVTAFLLIASCSPEASEPIAVGSYDFAENQLLAEIAAQSLESAGYAVVRLPSFQTRAEALDAFEAGESDVMVEYLGSLSTHLGQPPTEDVSGTMDGVRDAAEVAGVKLLTPASIDTAPAVVVLRSTAEALGLETISDLHDLAESFDIGAKQDCPIDEQCLLGLYRTYGLTFRSFVPLDAGGPLSVRALKEREVNVAVLFNSDSALAGDELKVLVDDRDLMATEALVPMVALTMDDARQRVVETSLLELTLAELRLLVGRIETGELTVVNAAEEYLSSR